MYLPSNFLLTTLLLSSSPTGISISSNSLPSQLTMDAPGNRCTSGESLHPSGSGSTARALAARRRTAANRRFRWSMGEIPVEVEDLLLLRIVPSVRLFADQGKVRMRAVDGVGFPGEPGGRDLDARFE